MEHTGSHYSQSSTKLCYEQPSWSPFPEGLIGPAAVVNVMVEGIPCRALLDSGSQVTIITREFHRQFLPQVKIHPLEGLAIWGLSNASYPYDGYVLVTLRFPAELAGCLQDCDTLALICPETQNSDGIPILIGTNSNMFQSLATLCGRLGQKTPDVVRPPWRELTLGSSTMPSDHDSSDDESLGKVVRVSKAVLSIPPHGEIDLRGKLEKRSSSLPHTVMMESSDGDNLPSGLMVLRGLLSLPQLEEAGIMVRIRNETNHPIAIRRGMVLARLYRVESVMSPAAAARKPCKALDPDLFNFGDSPVSPSWKDRLKKQLSERPNVFSTEEWDVGCALNVEHTIRLADDRPFRERSRRLAPADIEDVRKHIQELLEAGIISESRSPYASPIVVVRKKNGTVRMCVDYRTLNKRTIPDQYTVPRVDDALACLAGSRWFSVLDLRSGYYQIPMSSEDKEKTAFICPLGFYQFERMPQGISGAPATFQRLMEKTVGDMNLLEVLVYLDDLIVFGKTLEEHEARLMKVLDRLDASGLKLSLDKCQFCQTRVKYVGHIVSAEGVATDPEKIEALTTWPVPKDLKALQSFLGFCGYYRRFVKNYSSIVRPLTNLTRGYPPTWKRSPQHKLASPNERYFKVNEPFGDRWTEECNSAFHALIEKLTTAPVLTFADPTKPYELHVDASLDGLGAVLYQNYENKWKPVAFVSRGLTASERHYPVHKLEFLALKWAVVDKLHDYLYGATFVVKTDNNPLTYVQTTAKLDATGQRWMAALAAYDFKLQYRSGQTNADADALSRRPHNPLEEESEWMEIPSPAIRATCKAVIGKVQSPYVNEERYADTLGLSEKAIPTIYANLVGLKTFELPQLTPTELRRAQWKDSNIGPVLEAVEKGEKPISKANFSPGTILLLKEWDRLVINKGLLFRTTQTVRGHVRKQLVLPQEYQEMVLKSLHDDHGHLGVDKTLELVRDRFYWPKMTASVEDHCKWCSRCVKRKTLPKKAATMVNIATDAPMQLVCIDFLSLEPDRKNHSSILVVTDHFTRYSQAYPTKDQKASTVAKILWDKFFVHYGFPARIHSDQGRDFESRLIRELTKTLGIRKSRTTPYHPQGDPQPERFNRTLLNMLGTLHPSQKTRWSEHVSYLVHAYNCTKNESTGFSPYYLMFGREARLPIDLCFGISSDEASETTYLQYIQSLRRDLREAYRLASQAATKSNLANKQRYDSRVREQDLQVGDRVLIRNLGLTGKHKLADRWNADTYIVVDKLPDLPVYRLRMENGKNVCKTIHRNHLLPVGQLIGEEKNSECGSSRRPITRSRLRKKVPAERTLTAQLESAEEADSESLTSSGENDPHSQSSSEEEFFPYYPIPPMLHEQLCEVETVREGESEPPLAQILNPEAAPFVPPQSTIQHEEASGLPARMVPPVEDVGEAMQPAEREIIDCPAVITAENPENEEAPVLRRSERERKPVQKLTYDVPGSSTSVPLHLVNRWVRVAYYCLCLIVNNGDSKVKSFI